MIGTTYEISEENQKILKGIHDNMATHKVGMNHHATRLREEGQTLWDTIVELVPEMDTEKYIYLYDQRIGKVVCSRVKTKDDFRF